ncbi:MAG: xanthine dehydrogenase family protein subunit M [Chloroflexi bacterium]|nr:xanthine dehydrogenase family protein subunit M [Chloroflexota bacterium]
MIPPSFDYEAPTSVKEAVAILGKNPEAKILAGGQSLIALMKLRLASPEVLVDINKIEGLGYIKEDDGWLKIGAMTRESDLDASDLVRKKYPLLADTPRVIADPLVRNLSTLGGNLAHADPANDHPATMLAYGAELVASGPKGERTIPVEDFFTGPFETSLAQDELLTEIRIPAPDGKSGGAYVKMERKVGDFATAAVAAQVKLGNNGVVEQVGIGLTNVGLTPIKATAAEESLRGKEADQAAISEAAQLASEAAEPEEDPRGSVDYKRALVKTLTHRAIKAAVGRAQGGKS